MSGTRRMGQKVRVAWDRVPPATACTSPDGHDHIDTISPASLVPLHATCTRCGARWTIVTWEPQ